MLKIVDKMNNQLIDTYQEWCVDVLLKDVNEHGMVGNTEIRPLPYCLDGIIEETQEVVESTSENTLYDRLGVVLGVNQPDISTEALEIERHKKEFGDVSWYSAAALSLLDVKLSNACNSALIQQERTTSLPSLAEQHPSYPGLLLIHSLDRLRTAASNLYSRSPFILMNKDGSMQQITDPLQILEKKIILKRDERISKVAELANATGHYVLTASQVLPTYFGPETTFEDILAKNREKIEKRILDNTVHKQNGIGGDDR